MALNGDAPSLGGVSPPSYRCRMDAHAPLALVATCSRGLESVLAEELVALGFADVVAERGAVRFAGDTAAVHRANLWLRTATRLLLHLAEGDAGNRDALYALAAAVPWEEVVARGQTVAVSVAGRSAAFASTALAALVVKDALVDRLRQLRGVRPNVDRHDPDLHVVLHLRDQRASILLDASGEPLAHRGYRPRGGPAPLAETLAAGLLLLAGYDGASPFLDPMCGTGTIAIEAALLACRQAPGLHRTFACQRWGFLDPRPLANAVAEARALRRRAPAPIVASDRDPRAVQAARRNARAAGVAEAMTVAQRDVLELVPPGPGALIIANPPYGERLGERETLRGFYRRLGDALKQRAPGATAWLLVGDRELAKAVGLRASRRIPLFNGPIECRFLRYDLFAGPPHGTRGRGESAAGVQEPGEAS